MGTTPVPDEESVPQYGTLYPNGKTFWETAQFGDGLPSDLEKETGRAKAQDAYRLRVEQAGITPGQSTRLKFLTRTVTRTYSTPKEIS